MTSSQNHVQAQRSFTCFSNFPLEMRRQVWELTSFHERDINVHLIVVGFQLPSRHRMTQPFFYRSFSPPPALLHVNREAREEGLRHYRLSFGTELDVQGRRLRGPANYKPTIYANFESDCVWIRNLNQGDGHCMHFLSSGVRHMAFSVVDAEFCKSSFEIPWPVEDVYIYPYSKDPFTKPNSRERVLFQFTNSINTSAETLIRLREAEIGIAVRLDHWREGDLDEIEASKAEAIDYVSKFSYLKSFDPKIFAIERLYGKYSNVKGISIR